MKLKKKKITKRWATASPRFIGAVDADWLNCLRRESRAHSWGAPNAARSLPPAARPAPWIICRPCPTQSSGIKPNNSLSRRHFFSSFNPNVWNLNHTPSFPQLEKTRPASTTRPSPACKNGRRSLLSSSVHPPLRRSATPRYPRLSFRLSFRLVVSTTSYSHTAWTTPFLPFQYPLTPFPSMSSSPSRLPGRIQLTSTFNCRFSPNCHHQPQQHQQQQQHQPHQ